MKTAPKIPYAYEAADDLDRVIDEIIAAHPDKARQAFDRPILQGWFAAKVLKRFHGYGDYGYIVSQVGIRLAVFLNSTNKVEMDHEAQVHGN